MNQGGADFSPAVERPALARHFPALDGLRGLAIIVVILFHSTILQRDTVVRDYLVRILNAGWISVDLFFVLSGFLITGILCDAKGTPRFFTNFYARRSLRIFPLYFAVMILALLVLPEYFGVSPGSVGELWRFWFYLQNLGGPIPYPLSHTWSLAVEEQFYLLWPLVVFALSHRTLILVSAGLIPLALLIRCIMVATDVPGGCIHSVTYARFDPLAMGALIALLLREPGGLPALMRPAKWAFTLGLAVFLGVFAYQRNFWEGPLLRTIGQSSLCFWFGGLLVLAVGLERNRFLPRLLEAQPLRFFARYSYAMYLFHLPMHLWLTENLLGPRHRFNESINPVVLQGLVTLQTLVATTLLAMVSWHLLESPFLKLKRYFEYDKKRPDQAEMSKGSLSVPCRESPMSGST